MRDCLLATGFWLKAFVAFGVSVAVWVYFGFELMKLRGRALHRASRIKLGKPVYGYDEPEPEFHCSREIPQVVDTRLGSRRYRVSSGNLLEPEQGVKLWGFSIDWSQDLPINITQRLGNRSPAVVNAFIKITNRDFQADMISWHVKECQKIGCILQLSAQPDVDIATLRDSQLDAFATHLAHCNHFYGVPILLRYGHEMNGTC